jgi:rhomboid protease GluP
VFFLMLSVLTLGGLAWFVMEPSERARAERAVLLRCGRVFELSKRLRFDRDPLSAALRARTRFAFVTAGLVGVNLAVFAAVLLESGAPDDPATLVRWGASFGPATSNGEWWRLLTSTFVHHNVLHLAINLAALCSAGFVLERLVGHVTFAGVYAASGILGGIVSLSASPVAVDTGGAAAIFGLYGFLLATWTWGTLQKAATTVRLQTVGRLAPAAAVFVVYHAMDAGSAIAAAQVGLVTGLACGLGLARGVSIRAPRPRSVATTFAMAAAVAIAAAVPLRGVVDIRPDVDRVLASEVRLASQYQAEVDRFTAGRLTRRDLVHFIEATVLPELQAIETRLATFSHVPAEHRRMLLDAQDYLKLRDEGWRLRAVALRESSTVKLRQADKLEHDALVAFRKIQRQD